MIELNNIKVVLLGDSNVGKTSILNYYIDKGDLSKSPTIGASSRSKEVLFDGKRFNLDIWDTAGSESYRDLVPMYIHDAAAAVIVCDLTSQQSINNIEYWKAFVDDNGKTIVNILCCNKFDLETKKAVDIEEVQEIADKLNLNYFETSAVNGNGIDHMFEYIVSTYAIECPGDNAGPDGRVSLKEKKKKRKKCCK